MITTQCTSISVLQRRSNRLLSGPYDLSFVIDYNGHSFHICIKQLIMRRIIISTESEAPLDSFIKLFNSVDMLLMLMDGEFLIIENAEVVGADAQSSNELIEFFEHMPRLYGIADFARGRHSQFMEIKSAISSDMITTWLNILSELDSLYNMVLYSIANTGITIDCKCAMLIEAYNALSELLLQRVDGFSVLTNKKDKLSLKESMRAVIHKYGQDIFTTELEYEDAFLQILVNSRNRIAHIKSNQDQNYLTEEESVLYTVKLSYLYRRVLLELLDVDYSLYSDKIKESMSEWNEWEGILANFTTKLKQNENLT